MPGDNCAIVGCGSSRRTKGLGIFKIPSKKKYPEWRKEFLGVICRTRVVDKPFQDQIDKDRVFACEKHFLDSEYEIYTTEKMSKKVLKEKLKPVPSLNLPRPLITPPKRRKLERKNQNPLEEPIKNLSDVISKHKKFSLPENWTYEIIDSELEFKRLDPATKPAMFSIVVDSGLNFTITHYGWKLPEDHTIYKAWFRSVRKINCYDLMEEVAKFNVCEGVACTEFDGRVIAHPVELVCDSDSEGESPMQPFSSKLLFRSPKCEILHLSQEFCQHCENITKVEKEKEGKRNLKRLQPAKLKAPITKTAPQRVKLRLQQERLKCAQLEKRLEEMQHELQKSSINVDQQLNDDFVEIFSGAQKTTPFMNLFWQEQKKLFKKSASGVRYHPMIIRFCLSIASKSMSAYEELRNSNILRLPSSRTLTDYKNFITPKVGFQREKIDDLIDTTNAYSSVERYISFAIDEMKISSNLVYDKHSNALIGYVDLGDPEINYSTLPNEDTLASHAMVFFIRGIATNLKYSIAYFATNGITAVQMFPLLWEAISILELECNLWVVTVVSDGASANRRLYQMHKLMDKVDNNSDFCYRTVNLFAPNRFVYFFCDAPHLVKTARNCLLHSGFTKNSSRCMWKNGLYLLWQHIMKIWDDDLESPVKLIPKITYNHIHLTPYTKMTVSYAAQVLSRRVSIVLEEATPEFNETAKYCDMIDSFFDCLNVRHPDEWKRKGKPNLKEYDSVDDPRFEWLHKSFLKYFEDWQEEISKRPGKFDKADQGKMFVSWQTYHGFKITCHSVVEVVKFLLNQGVKYVMTERFCQDPLENYFGNQRGKASRSDNPDIQQFGYNDNSIRIQKHVTLSSGNTKGRYNKKNTWVNVTDQKIKRKQRKKKEKPAGLDKLKFI